MRRTDREVTDPIRIRDILARCTCCRLGLCDEGRVYIVPLSFGFEEREGRYTLYFHSAREGRKLRLIEETHYAAFEMDTHYRLNESDTPCGYSARFESIFGEGQVRFLTDPAEKRHALACIMAHTTGREGWTFPAGAEDSVCIFSLEVQSLSCKAHE